MPAKPLLLVDIDGVLSLWSTGSDTRPDGLWANVEGMLHCISTAVAHRLLDLRSDFELAWCSGWEERANEHLPHLVGLGPFPYVELDRHRKPGTSTPGAWKIGAIERHVEDPLRPVAWIDDVLDATCERWAQERPGPTLLVRTHPSTGLTEQQAAELRAWAASLPA